MHLSVCLFISLSVFVIIIKGLSELFYMDRAWQKDGMIKVWKISGYKNTFSIFNGLIFYVVSMALAFWLKILQKKGTDNHDLF